MSTPDLTKQHATESGARSTEAIPSHPIGRKHLGHHGAGTYLLRAFVKDDDRVFLRLVTLTVDGIWFSSHARQHSE